MILSIFLCLGVKAQYDEEKQPLTDVLDTLEERYGYEFNRAENTVANILLPSPPEGLSFEEVLAYLERKTGLKFKIGKGNIITVSIKRKTSLYLCGYIKDGETKEPLVGANIYYVENNEKNGVISDENGYFELEVDKKSQKIEISYQGYEIKKIKAKHYYCKSVVSHKKEACKTIYLKEEFKELDGIDVIAGSEEKPDETLTSLSGKHKRIRKPHVAKEIIDQKAIKNLPLFSYSDVAGNIPGMFTTTSSQTTKSVISRGFATLANPRFIQLVDGVLISSAILTFSPINLQGPSELDVDSIEFFPGISPTSYGINTSNGVMNIISKNPFEYPGVSFYVKTGITSSENAGNHEVYDIAIRLAHAFNEVVAAKASFSILRATDWSATDYIDYNNTDAIQSDSGYNSYGDEVNTTLDFDEIAIGMGVLPPGTRLIGIWTIPRTPYKERDLLDYDAQSIKADFALHFRPWKNDFEIIINSKIGRGNTIYQRANRYAIKGFIIQQHKVELRNKNFFIRGSLSTETAGNSYDTRFAAINLNRKWKSDKAWFNEYVEKFIQEALSIWQTGGSLEFNEIDREARAFADKDRLIPGTPEFRSALKAVTSDGSLKTGAKFIAKSKLYLVDANYNLSHITGDIADLQVGGFYRHYVLNSEGTIFADANSPINYDETGLYVHAHREFAKDRLKLTASFRYDKSRNFDENVLPGVSIAYSLGKKKNHTLRAYLQKGVRNPTAQDQYIRFNTGNVTLLGSVDLDHYLEVIENSIAAQALGLPETTELTGYNAYNDVYTAASVDQYEKSVANGNPAPSLLEIQNFDPVKPERVTTYEIDYRGLIADGKAAIGFNAYYNQYNDFIINRNVVKPHYGETDLSDINSTIPQPNALIAIDNKDYSRFQLYTNSPEKISSYGGSASINAKVFGGFAFGINYSFAKLDFNPSDDSGFRIGFNTPEHSVKASFGHPDLFKNFGFNINWRWSDAHFWESSFANGSLPARSVIDLQLNYRTQSTIIKLGATNLFGHPYRSAEGAGLVGSQFFVSWTFNLEGKANKNKGGK